MILRPGARRPAAFGVVAAATMIATALALAPAAPPATARTNGEGYYLVTTRGEVVARGDAEKVGDASGTPLNRPVVGMAADPDGSGYFLTATDGGVFAFDAAFRGSAGAIRLNQPVVGMAADTDGLGYWLVATDGGIFSYDAAFHGSTGNLVLNQPVVGMAADPDGLGYWLVAADGGVFAFDAEFHGSTGNIKLNQPIVGMAAHPGGAGYWFVARDGGVFTFGAAGFHGSGVDRTGGEAVTGMAATPSGDGYWLTTSTGRVLNFGDARSVASSGSPAAPVVGIAATVVTNDPPAAANDAVTTSEDTTTPPEIDVLANDTDADGDSLTITSFTQGAKGSVSRVSGSTKLKYTPAADRHGTDSFTYVIDDGHGGTDTGRVDVNITAVNDTPVANGDTATVAQSRTVSVNVAANDTGVGDTPVTYTKLTEPAKGSVTCTTAGVCEYTANTTGASANETDSFQYRVRDADGDVSGSTVTITITPFNTAPDATNDSFTSDEDLTVRHAVLANDTDNEQDPSTLTVTVETAPAHGDTAIDNGVVVYTPDGDYNGTDSYVYKVRDSSGATDTATVTVTLRPTDDGAAPVNDGAETTYGGTVTFNVLTNDYFADGFGSFEVTTVTTNGTLSCRETAPNIGQCTYTNEQEFDPASPTAKTDSFTYRVTDADGDTATATATITVDVV